MEFTIAVSTTGQLNDVVSWINGRDLSYNVNKDPKEDREKEKNTHISSVLL